MLKGASLVAGEWLGSDQTFQNEPTSGASDRFAVGTPAMCPSSYKVGRQSGLSIGGSGSFV